MPRKASKAFLKKLEIAACSPHTGRGPTRHKRPDPPVKDEPAIANDGELIAIWGFTQAKKETQ